MLFLVVMIFVTTYGVFAQNDIASPYSRFGLGSTNTNKTNTALQGMGGLSVAMDGKHMLNNTNPAAYAEIDSLTFLLDAGFYMRYSTFRAADQIEKGSDANFDFFDIGFGITKWWKTGLGFTPFSSRDYISKAEYEWMYPYNTDYEGYGGLNKFYWANGFKVYKGLSLGVRMDYIFGNITDQTTLYFPYNNEFLNVRRSERLMISELNFSLGLIYKYNFKNDYQLSVGLTYGIPTNWKGHRDNFIRTMFKGYNTTATTETPIDTIAYSTMQRVNIHYPQSFGSGITLKKGDRWLVGADFTWGNWADYKMNGVSDSIQNCWTIVIGGSYSPANTSVSNYFKKITYRAGIHYDQTIFNIYGQSVNKYGISLGFGMPILRSMTMLNFAFEFGKMGTTQSNLIEDTYFNISFGVSIHDRWFVKRRYK